EARGGSASRLWSHEPLLEGKFRPATEAEELEITCRLSRAARLQQQFLHQPTVGATQPAVRLGGKFLEPRRRPQLPALEIAIASGFSAEAEHTGAALAADGFQHETLVRRRGDEGQGVSESGVSQVLFRCRKPEPVRQQLLLVLAVQVVDVVGGGLR